MAGAAAKRLEDDKQVLQQSPAGPQHIIGAAVTLVSGGHRPVLEPVYGKSMDFHFPRSGRQPQLASLSRCRKPPLATNNAAKIVKLYVACISVEQATECVGIRTKLNTRLTTNNTPSTPTHGPPVRRAAGRTAAGEDRRKDQRAVVCACCSASAAGRPECAPAPASHRPSPAPAAEIRERQSPPSPADQTRRKRGQPRSMGGPHQLIDLRFAGRREESAYAPCAAALSATAAGTTHIHHRRAASAFHSNAAQEALLPQPGKRPRRRRQRQQVPQRLRPQRQLRDAPGSVPRCAGAPRTAQFPGTTKSLTPPARRTGSHGPDAESAEPVRGPWPGRCRAGCPAPSVRLLRRGERCSLLRILRVHAATSRCPSCVLERLLLHGLRFRL